MDRNVTLILFFFGKFKSVISDKDNDDGGRFTTQHPQ